MVATSGYQAGVEATQVQIGYNVEATWGTNPASAMQLIRFMSETLAGTKTRTRPNEIVATAELAAAVTTEEKVAGDIGYALSYGTFDDFFSGALKNDWQVPVVITGAAGNITMTAGSPAVLSSTTANEFANIAIGQWIQTFGFTNAANNDIWRVTAKADADHLSLVGASTAVTETPAGAAANVRASTIMNAAEFKSFYLQKQFSPTLNLQYPGLHCTGFTLDAAMGKEVQGKFTFIGQGEISGTGEFANGTFAAPTGLVNNPVGGFGPVFWNNVPLTSVVDSISLTVTSKGSAQEFGLGNANAQGLVMGQTDVAGDVKIYFKDFTLFAEFTSETLAPFSFITSDAAGNAYVFTILNAALMNPKILAGGVNQPVYASFTLEGNPQAAGGTIQIDRLPI